LRFNACTQYSLSLKNSLRFLVTKNYKTLLEGPEEFKMSELNHNFFLLEVDVRDVKNFIADALESTQPGNQARGSLLNPKNTLNKKKRGQNLSDIFSLVLPKQPNLRFLLFCVKILKKKKKKEYSIIYKKKIYEVPSPQKLSPKESTR
jgi:hypothetical protein